MSQPAHFQFPAVFCAIGFLRPGRSHAALGPEGLPHASSMDGRLLRRGLAPHRAFSQELCKLPRLEMQPERFLSIFLYP